jgi:histidinol phosphatase-like PHP family hydrolase
MQATEAVPKPPPIRSGFLSLTQARRALAQTPLRANGDLQSHTTWSDGKASPAEMAAAAQALGRAYLAITDHTHGLKIAGGMSAEEIVAQGRVIEEMNGAFPPTFTVLRGVEANLAPNGTLDVTAKEVEGLDLVLGAFHSALRRTEDQTERYLAALRNPLVDVLAHPRCRVYDRRLGLVADWSRVCDEVARQGKAIEVDAYPDRQDLDLATLEQARAAGCFVSLGTDAHRPDELDSLDLGLAAVTLAGIPQKRLLNAWPAEEVKAWALARRCG